MRLRWLAQIQHANKVINANLIRRAIECCVTNINTFALPQYSISATILSNIGTIYLQWCVMSPKKCLNDSICFVKLRYLVVNDIGKRAISLIVFHAHIADGRMRSKIDHNWIGNIQRWRCIRCMHGQTQQH